MSAAQPPRRLASTAFRALVLALLCLTPPVWAGGRGLFGLDRYDELEDVGIWSRSNQKRLDALVIGGVISMALWEGTESASGRLWWQTMDSIALSAVATETLKRITQRKRPAQSEDPNEFFAGSKFKSFPSGETALMAAAVTPVILARADENPWNWAWLALPAYMGRARMASQGHWLSDVLAGAALGATSGWMASKREHPLMLGLTRDGVFIGIRERF